MDLFYRNNLPLVITKLIFNWKQKLENRHGLSPVSFFNGISTFVSYLMPRSSLYKNRCNIIWPTTGQYGLEKWNE